MALGDDLARLAHVVAVVVVPQPVVDHVVGELAVAEADAGATTEQQVRGVAHGLHAAGEHHVAVSGLDGLSCEHDGLQRAAADLVDRERRNRVRNATPEGGSTGRVLTQARLQDVAHDDFLDFAGIDAGAGHDFTDHDGAEVRGFEAAQAALVLANRRAAPGDDDRLVHWSSKRGAHLKAGAPAEPVHAMTCAISATRLASPHALSIRPSKKVDHSQWGRQRRPPRLLGRTKQVAKRPSDAPFPPHDWHSPIRCRTTPGP